MKSCFLSCFLLASVLHADIKSTNGKIGFDVDSDGQAEMTLRTTGLGIGVEVPSANLHVSGNAQIENGSLIIGGTEGQSDLQVNGSVSFSIQTVSSNITASGNTYLLVDTAAAGGNLNLILPEASDYPGRFYNIKKISTDHDLTVVGFVDSSEYVTMGANQSKLPYLSLMSNGNTWSILGQSENVSSVSIAGDNLIAYYKFDETSGSIAADSSSTGNDVTVNDVNFATDSIEGKVRTALDFDGNSDYLELGDMDSVELTDVSFVFWVNFSDTDNDYDVFSKGQHMLDRPLIIWHDDSVGGIADLGGLNVNTISVLTYDGTIQHWVAAPSNSIVASTWHHVAVVIEPSSNTLSVYVDGELGNTNTKAWNGIEANANQVRIGVDSAYSRDLDGGLDDVRIYNKALSLDEVKQLYLLGQ